MAVIRKHVFISYRCKEKYIELCPALQMSRTFQKVKTEKWKRVLCHVDGFIGEHTSWQ